MVRAILAFNTLLFLVLPGAVTAQTFTLQTESTSTISYKLQQLLQQPPTLSSYILQLIPGTDDAINKLEAALLKPMPAIFYQGTTTVAVSSTTIQTLLDQVAVLQKQIEDIIVAREASSTPVVTAEATSTPSQENIPAASGTVACPDISRLLSFGAKGDDVANLQIFLIAENHLEQGAATGFFGKLTEAAVQAWQLTKSIVTEGTPATTGFGAVGPKTRAALADCR